MTCITDTASINLTQTSGQLSADLVVDPGAGLPPNPLTVNAAGVYVIGADGWIPLPSTLAFQSADGHTFVVTSSADLRSFIGPGDKIRIVQSGVPGYYFVTAITAGTITLYGGTDYTVAALAISTPYFSKSKSPIGFPLSPIKWTEELRDTSDRSQASPVDSTWYNPGSLSIAIPIGAWDVYFETAGDAVGTGAAGQDNLIFATTLSTANNSETDVDFSSRIESVQPNASAAVIAIGGTFMRRKALALAVKTSYFVNAMTTRSNLTLSSLTLKNASWSPAIVRAICAYL